ncbi:hypothetical protein RCL1_001917 [Eukaryota sp. TZLM3-RCL]
MELKKSTGFSIFSAIQYELTKKDNPQFSDEQVKTEVQAVWDSMSAEEQDLFLHEASGLLDQDILRQLEQHQSGDDSFDEDSGEDTADSDADEIVINTDNMLAGAKSIDDIMKQLKAQLVYFESMKHRGFKLSEEVTDSNVCLKK